MVIVSFVLRIATLLILSDLSPEMIIDWNDKKFPGSRSMAGALWHALPSLSVLKLSEKVEQLKQLDAPKRADWLPKDYPFWSFHDATFVFGCITGVRTVSSLKYFPATSLFLGEVESEKWKLRALKRMTLQVGTLSMKIR